MTVAVTDLFMYSCKKKVLLNPNNIINVVIIYIILLIYIIYISIKNVLN